MFGKPKVPDDAKQYGELGTTGRKNWRKYKETGKPKYKDRAQEAYDTQKALGIKMANPGTTIVKDSFNNTKNFEIKDSFKKTKNVNVKVGLKIKPKIKKSK